MILHIWKIIYVKSDRVFWPLSLCSISSKQTKKNVHTVRKLIDLFNEKLRHIDKYLENGVSISLVYMIKLANFQLYTQHPDGFIQKIWKLTTNLQTNEFDFSYIKGCVSLKRVEKKKLLGRHNKNISFLKTVFGKQLFAATRSSVKKLLLKISLYSQKNTCVRDSF